MLSRFHLIREPYERTDGQTDGQTDGRTDLLYQYRASVRWRAIKIICLNSIYGNLVTLFVYPLMMNILARKLLLSEQNCKKIGLARGYPTIHTRIAFPYSKSRQIAPPAIQLDGLSRHTRHFSHADDNGDACCTLDACHHKRNKRRPAWWALTFLTAGHNCYYVILYYT